jgi:uncharacterized membrane protein
MKPLLILFIAALSFASNAQSVDIPQKEFTVSLSEETLNLARGENKKVDIRILKSKAYQKGKMKMGLSSSLPAGITLSFDPENGSADVTQATVTALPDAQPGTYSIIVNSTINYKTKGSILKITIR